MTSRHEHPTRRDFLRTTGKAAALGLGSTFFSAACGAQPPLGGRGPKPPVFRGKGPPFYDTHAHLFGMVHLGSGGPRSDYDGAARVALGFMDRLNILKTFIMPPPFTFHQEHSYDYPAFIDVLKRYPTRFKFLGGGGTLNVMIQEAVHQGRVGRDLKERFKKKAHQILNAGALGFGEMTAEHFSFDAKHPYEYAPPDHPLFLLLADIAAARGVPIDLHMEAVPKRMRLPSHLWSPPNPRMIEANIARFENFLAHNRKAKVMWAHVGWGHTGHRTTALCGRLLGRNPNLYMSFKMHRHSVPQNRPLARGVGLKPEWLALITKFPDRFVIGTDQFYLAPGAHRRLPTSVYGPAALMRFLPPGLARRVGLFNPRRIYNLKS
ncbi:MAG: amidohydrolase [Proteobacteria bacterium]|nr:amidohydrolase [Pseudomonadota bacterium]